jgi:ribosomal protein L11 methyltransferase
METLKSRWWEISVLSDRSLEESIFWRLQQFGCQGMACQGIALGQNLQLKINAYIPHQKISWLDLSALSLLLKQDATVLSKPLPSLLYKLIWDEDWSSSWKQHWHPQPIGDRFTIYPAWIEVPTEDSRQALRIDPGSAFGTGTHATTQMSLEALEFRMWGATEIADFRFADIGCGSGILGIGAIFLGAKQVYAVDTDFLAIEAMHHNCKLNQISEDRFWVTEGSIQTLLANIPQPLHGFACNIQANIIAPMIPHFVKLIKPDGWGILSGILVDQAPQIMDILHKEGWTVATLWKRDQWSCLTIRRD